MIASSLQCEGTAYFLSAVDAGTNKKTAAYCTTVAQDAIDKANKQYQSIVTGVVTDNEKKMVAMKQNLVESNPDLTVHGCSAHWLHLLGQNTTPVQVINQVVEINKYFRNHHIQGALLSVIPESVKPQLPAETRWNSQLTCVDIYCRNKPFMLMIIAQNEDIIDSRIRNIIHNVGLYNEVKNLEQQLKPVSISLDKLLSDSSTIADACEVWLDLLQHPDLDPYQSNVNNRFKQAMTPAHFLANALHPVDRGKSSNQTMFLLLKSYYSVPMQKSYQTSSTSLQIHFSFQPLFYTSLL